MKKSNVLFGILGIAYLIAIFLPLVKSLISGRKTTSNSTYEEWVELPLLK